MTYQFFQKLLKEEWLPDVYRLEHLQKQGISGIDAQNIIESINGPLTPRPWVFHHDLLNWAKDLYLVSNPAKQVNPNTTVYGRWLLGRGWRHDESRKIYCWVPPAEDRIPLLRRYNTRVALDMELFYEHNLSMTESSKAVSPDSYVEATFSIQRVS